MKLSPRKKIGAWRHVGDSMPAGFPPTGRSASCALESEVSGQRRACREKSPMARKSDGGDVVRRVLEGE